MRVLHIITRMIIGGAQENTLFNCLDLIRDYGDEVCLITGMETGPEGDLLDKGRAGGLQVRYVPNLVRAIHPWKDWQSLRSIRGIIRDFRPDVVHTHSAQRRITRSTRRVLRTSSRDRTHGAWSAVSPVSVLAGAAPVSKL